MGALPHADRRTSTCAAPPPTPAAASWARPGASPPSSCSRTGSGARSREGGRRRDRRRPQRPRHRGAAREGRPEAARARAARPCSGGAAVTEEFHPGFKVSTVAHLLGPLRPSLIEDLDLGNRGLGFIEPEPRVFAPLPERRRRRAVGRRREDRVRDAQALGAADADRYPEFHRSLGRDRRLPARAVAVHDPAGHRPPHEGADLLPWLGLGMGFRGLGREDAQRLLRWGPMAVADFASEWFSTEVMRAIVCARGHLRDASPAPGRRERPRTSCSRPRRRAATAPASAVQVMGGLGAVSDALAGARAPARRGDPHRRRGRARSACGRRASPAWCCAGGEEIAARAVVSSADPHHTFLRLLDPAVLDPDDLRRVRNYRQKGMASKVNLALSGLPAFRGALPRPAARPDPHRRRRRRPRARVRRREIRRDLAAPVPRRRDPVAGRSGAGARGPSRDVGVRAVHAVRVARRDRGPRGPRELGDLVTRLLDEYAPGFARARRAPAGAHARSTSSRRTA